jgi:hypothetical protein
MVAFNAVISYLMTRLRSCISTTRSSNMDVFFATVIYKVYNNNIVNEISQLKIKIVWGAYQDRFSMVVWSM